MSLNKVMLIGRLGRNPEIRYMPNGDAVCNFSLATSETWNDKKSGSKQERTEWHNITMYGRVAEVAGKYLRKGSLTYIEGRIQSRKYTDKTGVERTAYEIIANEMKMLGSKNDNAGGQDIAWDNDNYSQGSNQKFDTSYTQSNYPEPHQEPHFTNSNVAPHTTPPEAPTQHTLPPATPMDDIDDDIPF